MGENDLNENENAYDDFDKVLLQLKEGETNDIKEIKEIEDPDDAEIDIESYTAKNKWHVYKEIANIFLDRSKNDSNIKEKYSMILIIILILQLFVMNVIFILRGANVLDFLDTTFNIFITATIAEVFALITIIVKYLFTDNLTKLLSNILTNAKEENINSEDKS